MRIYIPDNTCLRSTWTANAGVDCSGSTCDWGQIRIHDYKGALVASIALPAPGGASQKWNGILGSLTLDDVDGNGLLGELVIARRLLFFVFVCVCVCVCVCVGVCADERRRCIWRHRQFTYGALRDCGQHGLSRAVGDWTRFIPAQRSGAR